MEEIIKVEERYYILATSSLADTRTRVLKNVETFAVFDRFGDIQTVGLGEQGIYHNGTRHLSRSALRLQGLRLLLLSSTIKEDNALFTADLTNPDIFDSEGRVLVPRGTLHIFRSKFLWKGACYEAIRLRNFGLQPLDTQFTLRFDADFADIFEVRGMERPRRGARLEDRVENGTIVLSYEGLDGVLRRTRVSASPAPSEIWSSGMQFSTHLDAQREAEFFITISCETGQEQKPGYTYQTALMEATDALNALRSQDCQIYSANEQFNGWLNRSASDLHMMVTVSDNMVYPYAGVPWFSTVFGRDGIITALEYLWVNPLIARGVLLHLAETQATEVNRAQDAEPGKILHEQRGGEMAALGEHPFRRYYGSVDSTPLFVMLAGAYYERTADFEFIRSIWPNILRALEWIDKYGDSDGDGFVEYCRHTQKGLIQQGWKDSYDSVSHANGTLAEPPIALCEVQAYVYAAKRAAANLAAALGDADTADRLIQEAFELQERFEQAFWSDELSTYVLALDGDKRPCNVRSSNAGHCLFAGIASRDHAEIAAEVLLSSEMFSGWGIRTLSASEVRYNPMSYHNGSVWPHDNALIAFGLARYGMLSKAAKILSGLFDAALFLDQHRLPELFCGFGRRVGEGPTLYPVACSPQAWAAASPFLLLQACLGLNVSALDKTVRFHHGFLPEFVPEVVLRNLSVGGAKVDIEIRRHAGSLSINVLKKQGKVEILVAH
ncbi:MAG TPA: amylo-alpha-1,6-glucosidase [Bryobacteraceae bacterium]|nr:amylo-alpha-1,6-glucosidase [Bryobacteraceae bacterium]HOQ46247.1 amylo-alpha-1,6-glucosidase [Bryobacteraceae bacterium]HPU74236.1 amylo-alpha-1,6-glucosidase [Bryobacteraceae bacterium]